MPKRGRGAAADLCDIAIGHRVKHGCVTVKALERIEKGVDLESEAGQQHTVTLPAAKVATLPPDVQSQIRRTFARDAAGKPGTQAWVSLGPYGALLADGSEYRGDYELSEAELKEWHATRLDRLLAAEHPRPPDGLAFETVPKFEEVRGILSLLCERRYAETPAWVSFSCRDGAHLCDGTPLVVVAAACRDAFARRPPSVRSYLGVNCVPATTVDAVLDALLPAAQGSAATGIVVYPNGGGTWDAADRCWKCEDGTPPYSDQLAGAWAKRINDAGLEAIIGGCCQTDCRTIAALHASLLDPDR